MKSGAQNFVRNWLPVIIWMLIIFIGSTDLMSAEHTSRFLLPFLHWLKPDISLQTIARIHFAIRKFGHITEYAILAMLFLRALRGQPKRMAASLIFASWLFAAVFAASDEFHQSFFPSRTASPVDVLIDMFGATLGLAIFVAIIRRPRLRAQTITR